MRFRIQLGDIGVDVIRKDIKNVHLSVHPPTGRVRIAAPEHMSLDTASSRLLNCLGSRNNSARCGSKSERPSANTLTGKVTTYGEIGTC